MRFLCSLWSQQWEPSTSKRNLLGWNALGECLPPFNQTAEPAYTTILDQTPKFKTEELRWGLPKHKIFAWIRVCGTIKWNDNLAQAPTRTKIPRVSFFSWQGGENEWQKKEQGRNLDLDWLLNLSSIQLSTGSLHLHECWTHNSQHMVTCRSAVEWPVQCQNTQIAILTLPRTQNHTGIHSTVAGLFMPTEMSFRH